MVGRARRELVVSDEKVNPGEFFIEQPWSSGHCISPNPWMSEEVKQLKTLEEARAYADKKLKEQRGSLVIYKVFNILKSERKIVNLEQADLLEFAAFIRHSYGDNAGHYTHDWLYIGLIKAYDMRDARTKIWSYNHLCFYQLKEGILTEKAWRTLSNGYRVVEDFGKEENRYQINDGNTIEQKPLKDIVPKNDYDEKFLMGVKKNMGD